MWPATRKEVGSTPIFQAAIQGNSLQSQMIHSPFQTRLL